MSYTAEQVIAKLDKEIAELGSWLLEKSNGHNSTHHEKLNLLHDKIKERDRIIEETKTEIK